MQLDGLRGVAILGVVLHHATLLHDTRTALSRAALALPSMGWAGVDLFFVLSGFLITRILVRERGAPRYFAAFYWRRVLRIFPLYYALVGFCLVVVPALHLFAGSHELWLPGATRRPGYYWVFLGNFYEGLEGRFQHSVFAITWSLAIEEQFYAVWPLLVARVSTRKLEAGCAAVVIGAATLRVFAVARGAPWLLVYVATPFRLDALAVGAWIALRSERRGFDALARIQRWALPIASCAVALLVAVLVADPGSLLASHGSTMLRHPLTQTAGYSALAATAGGVIVKAMTDPPESRLRRVLEARPLRELGKISYALYLAHVPVIAVVTAYVFDPRRSTLPTIVALVLFDAIVLVVGVGVAELSWWGLESRALALRDRVPFRPAR